MAINGCSKEVLLALIGEETALFEEDGRVREYLDPFKEDPLQDNILHRLSPIVLAVRRCRSFAHKHSSTRELTPASAVTECEEYAERYLIVLANGILSVLDQFVSDMATLSEEMDKDDNLHLSFLLARVSRSCQFWLTELCDLIDAVEQTKPRNGEVISLIYSHWLNAVDQTLILKLEILMSHCHRLFEFELLQWLTLGEVASGGDFWVQQVREENLDEDWWGCYCLQSSQLPSYVSDNAKDMILFIGQAVRLMSLLQDDPVADLAHKSKRLEPWKQVFSRIFNAARFVPDAFNDAIAACSDATGRQLWQVLFPRGNRPLLIDVNRLRQFYLLGATSVWTAFLRQAISSEQDTERPEKRLELLQSVLLREVAAYSDLNDANHVHLTIADTGKDRNDEQWPRYKLTVTALNQFTRVLFSGQLYESCQKAFQLLSIVSCVQLQLDGLYLQSLRYLRTKFQQSNVAGWRRIWVIRATMSCFVRPLQSFLFYDCIAPLMRTLNRKMMDCNEYKEAKRALDEFAWELASECGLNTNMGQDLLLQLLLSCLQFTNGLTEICLRDSDLDSVMETAAKHGDRFNRLARLLFNVFTEQHNLDSRRRLNPLLTRLNFSAFYS